jgi:hypothetical protein
LSPVAGIRRVIERLIPQQIVPVVQRMLLQRGSDRLLLLRRGLMPPNGITLALDRALVSGSLFPATLTASHN